MCGCVAGIWGEGLFLVLLAPPLCPLTASPQEGKRGQRRKAHPGSVTRDHSGQAGLRGIVRGLVWAGGCLSPLSLSFEQAAHCPLSRFYYYPRLQITSQVPFRGRPALLAQGLCLPGCLGPAEGPKQGPGSPPESSPGFRCLNRALS